METNNLHDQHAREVSIWLRGIKLKQLGERISAQIENDRKLKLKYDQQVKWAVAFLLSWGVFQVLTYMFSK